MSDSFKSIPDPMLPEHRMLKDVAEMPVLSSGFRDRVILNVHQQAKYGRWADRFRIIASTAAAILIVTCVWSFRENRSDRAASTNVVAPSEMSPNTMRDMSTAPSSGDFSGAASHAANPVSPNELQNKPQSGGGQQKLRPDLNEMQQINQLIEHYQQRQNAICGFLPLL